MTFIPYSQLRNGDIFNWKFQGTFYKDDILMLVDKDLQRAGQCLQLSAEEPYMTWFSEPTNSLEFNVIDHIDMEAISI